MAVLYTPDRIPEALVRVWGEACRAQALGLECSPEWYQVMTGGNQEGGRVATGSPAGPVLGCLLPLLRTGWRFPPRVPGWRCRGKLPALKAVGGDVVGSDITRPALRDLLDAIAAQEPGVSVLWFDHLASADRRAALDAAARGSAWFVHDLSRALPHYRMHLPPTLAACHQRRSGKTLARLRAKEHALSRDAGGVYRLIQFRGPEEWEPYAGTIQAMMNRSWQIEQSGEPFALNAFRAYSDAGMLRGFILMAGERALAMTLYYSLGQTLVSGVLGYDRDFSSHSPGAILFLKTLEALYADAPPAVLDFGEGDAEYKQQWADEEFTVDALVLLRRRPSLYFRAGVDRALAGTMRCVKAMRRRRG